MVLLFTPQSGYYSEPESLALRDRNAFQNAVVALPLSGRDRPSFWVCYPGATSLRAASSLDGCLHEFGREERERDRHIDLSNAHLPRQRWLDEMIAGTVTSVEQPRAIAATSVARVSARIGRRSWGREAGTKNIASPPHRRLEKPPYLQSWIVPFGSLSPKTLKNALKFERAGTNRDEQKGSLVGLMLCRKG
jgi:hypothetical protein